MSDDINNRINNILGQQDKTIEQNPSDIRIKADRVCVIITQNKNSSWIDDLDARERLNKHQVVFH